MNWTIRHGAALLPLVAITDVYATGPTAASLVVRGVGGETHEIGGVGLLDCEDLQAAIARLRFGEDPQTVAQSFANTERGRGRRALRFSLAAAVLVLTLLAAGQLLYYRRSTDVQSQTWGAADAVHLLGAKPPFKPVVGAGDVLKPVLRGS